MSRGIFDKALKDATFSVTTSREGGRSFGGTDSDRGGYQGRRGSRGGGRWRGRGRGSRFRGRGRGGGGRGNSGGPSSTSYLDADDDNDEDFDMDGSGELQFKSDRFNPYNRPRGHRGRPFNQDSRPFNQYDRGNKGFGESGKQLSWNKIVIPGGKKHDKEWLIKKLQNACEQAFQPVEFHFKGDSACFFVEDNRAAEALKRISHQITVRDGSKLVVSVRPCPPPRVTRERGGETGGSWDSKTEQVVKECLSQRYNIAEETLDLSDLFHDKVLNQNNVQGILSRIWLASGIQRCIGENCPEVKVLDLSNNRLHGLDVFKDLVKHASNLRSLKLGNNQMRGIEELEKLKNLSQLTTIVLEGNPLCEKYQNDASGYVSAVRSKLPNITNLDGRELPPPIGFDLPSAVALPKTQDSFLGDPRIKDLVLKFLEQYYKIYDSGDRQPLLDAYHDQAMFSMSANPGPSMKDRGPRGPSLGDYMKNSRNLKRVSDTARRISLLKHSRLSVVAFLNELPATKHDLTSFTVDVSLVIPSSLTFSVRGLFTEENKNIRAFTRVFVALAVSGGKALSIINDELHIRNASQAQIEAAQCSASPAVPSFSEGIPSGITPTPAPTPVFDQPAGAPTNSLPTQTPALGSQSAQQRQMVLQFSTQSGMNAEWSFKCLEDNGWNYEKAAQVFSTLQASGSIPPEAFVK